MRVIKAYDLKGIRAYKLGWSLVGAPLMTTHCYVLGDLMIDTGLSHMQPEVLEIARYHNIKRIYLTHHHEDHSGNAAVLKRAGVSSVFGHPLTVEKMSRPFKILPYQTYVWGKATPLEVKKIPRKNSTPMGDMIPIHTPGHSKDHTAYFLEDAGILFSGDLYLADQIKFFRSDEDMGTQIESLKKILKFEFSVLLCSHFPKLENGKKRIQSKLAFLEDLYGRIVTLWEKGLPERQIFCTLNLKEAYSTKLICFGNVSMLNGVRSAIRHHDARN